MTCHAAPVPMLAWERDDEAQGHSVARWEAVADDWRFHGTEVLIAADEVLSA